MISLLYEQSVTVVLIVLAIFLMSVLTMKAKWEKRRLQGVAYSWIALLLILSIGGFCNYTVSERAKNKIKQQLSSLAQAFASAIQRMGHAEISLQTPRNVPSYERIIAQLVDWQDRISYVASIYTMRKDEQGRFLFIFDPEADLNRNGMIDSEIEKEIHIGTIYVPPKDSNGIAEFNSTFNGIANFSKKLTKDDFGVWITATVPLRDKNGNVEAILGVDFWGEDWQREIHATQFWPSAFFILFLLLFFFVQLHFRRVEGTEKTLKENAESLELLVSELREAKRKADNASQAKSQFLANMSHEIRTPMTAILGYNEFLADPIIDNKQRREAIRIVRNNADLLLQILNDILDFSKMEAGKMNLEIRQVSIVPLLDEIAILFFHQVNEKKIELIMENSTPFPETIHIDSIRLKQILMNIIGNAVKFTNKGGVYLTLSWKSDPIDKKRGVLVIEIRDTGIGMSHETQNQLFQPFQQADTSTTRHYGGTGLGLAIVNRLVHLLCGRIEVESTPGVGSVFRLFFPQSGMAGRMLGSLDEGRSIAESTFQSESRKNRSLEGRRILFAEDGKDIQRLFNLVLNKAGANVVLADNGLQAFETAMNACRAGESFDIIVMDMQMPIMDGYTAVRKLRETGYDKPIVALTAAALQSEIDLCLSAGCNDYAIKPISMELFLEFLLRNLPA